MGERLSVCNGCGQRKPTSREHLVHVAVARVLLKDRKIKTGRERDAALRNHPFLSGLRLYRNPLEGDPERSAHLTVWVENLLCRDCNGEWARRLEEEAGAALYQFVHLHRPASPILRAWAFFFAIKLWWSQRRAEALRWGDLLPVLRAIRDDRDVPTSIRVAQVRGSHWNFASTAGRWVGDPPHIVFIIWNVVFIVTRIPKGQPVPWPSVELEAGITRSALPVLGRPDLRALFTL